jgi:hypothetical protein
VGTNDDKNLVIKPSVMIYGSAESKSDDYYEESGDVLANQYRDYMLQIKMPRKSKSRRKTTKKVKPYSSDEASFSGQHFFPDDHAKRHHRSLQPPNSAEQSGFYAASGEGSIGDAAASQIWEDDRVLTHLLKAAKDLNIGVKLATK